MQFGRYVRDLFPLAACVVLIAGIMAYLVHAYA